MNYPINPMQWCWNNRQWRRIDNIDHAKFQLNRVGSNKTFWKAVLEILGA